MDEIGEANICTLHAMHSKKNALFLSEIFKQNLCTMHSSFCNFLQPIHTCRADACRARISERKETTATKRIHYGKLIYLQKRHI